MLSNIFDIGDFLAANFNLEPINAEIHSIGAVPEFNSFTVGTMQPPALRASQAPSKCKYSRVCPETSAHTIR